MSTNYSKMTRKFLMGEAFEPPTTDSFIQSLEEILSNIKTNVGGQKRLEIAKSHLRELRRNFRRLNNKVHKLEEQLRVLEEERSK